MEGWLDPPLLNGIYCTHGSTTTTPTQQTEGGGNRCTETTVEVPGMELRLAAKSRHRRILGCWHSGTVRTLKGPLLLNKNE